VIVAKQSKRWQESDLEHLLPDEVRERWLELLTDRRKAIAEDDQRRRSGTLDFGTGLLWALKATGQIDMFQKMDLQELLVYPGHVD
jgi:hypothetical protein